jgi:thiamine monophosphate kinase
VAIVGGDTNSWDGPLVVSVTLLGEATERGPVTRRGARPGDWLLVTGGFGGSILGKHLDFTPRVREAQRLHERADLHAMIDVSDGLAADVHHLCEESGCGAWPWSSRPRRAGLRMVARWSTRWRRRGLELRWRSAGRRSAWRNSRPAG